MIDGELLNFVKRAEEETQHQSTAATRQEGALFPFGRPKSDLPLVQQRPASIGNLNPRQRPRAPNVSLGQRFFPASQKWPSVRASWPGRFNNKTDGYYCL